MITDTQGNSSRICLEPGLKLSAVLRRKSLGLTWKHETGSEMSYDDLVQDEGVAKEKGKGNRMF